MVSNRYPFLTQGALVKSPPPDRRCGPIQTHLFLCWAGFKGFANSFSPQPSSHPTSQVLQLFSLVLTSAVLPPLRKSWRAASWTTGNVHFCKGLWQQLPPCLPCSCSIEQSCSVVRGLTPTTVKTLAVMPLSVGMEADTLVS